MSGHNKWASIKHKKGAADAKRGRLFTKLIREITVAAKEGGGSPDTNARLRTAIDRAKEANMPKDNIEKGIKKGTGELPGVTYENCSFEGYGPAGVAILIEGLTDNKNRTTAEVRNIFSKRNGNMAGVGSVAWIFTAKGYIEVDKTLIDEEEIFSLSVDAGAEDVKTGDKAYEITCDPMDLETIKGVLKEKGLNWETADITKVPNSTIKLNGVQAKQVLALVEALEDQDDVQKVFANFDIPDNILEEIAQEL
ncbi:MAG: YebC/PmpR family DNA-binding transcriptional regulator [Candidatus Omnitrophica bacterium]|nr:YebC/PmpR family DNA-binding transcriptional regulator [Candidatus Omnitrophota bacterium]